MPEVLLMVKMTKSQAKKRLMEAKSKVKAVWANYPSQFGTSGNSPVTFADMAAIEKILDKCLKRFN